MLVRELASFCWADREFFDTPDRVFDADSRYVDPTAVDPDAWQRAESGAWVNLRPTAAVLPEQGWKVHVSTTPADSVKVLDIVWRYCVDKSITFKFVRSERLLWLMNEKSFPRELSGKFITIYPRDTTQLESVLADLDDVLSSFPGPYVLGDLRYRNGPLYVRYGAFTLFWCTTDAGDPAPAVRRPDGSLVPDVRSAVFTVPDWVELPEFLEPDLAERKRQVEDEFPYRITAAIQFANSGGVYLATDERTGERVVVREGRPHAGLDVDGTDAVHRIARERRMLERLAGLDCVPRLLDYRVVQGHHFLIEEYVEGETLLVAVVTKIPLADYGISERDRAEYTAWAHEVMDNVERALAAIHERGLSFGDLHPSNIVVRPDNSVVFVDFEFAADAADDKRPLMAAQGFIPPPPLSGVEADRYALERVRLMSLLPVTSLVERDPSKLDTLIDAATSELPVPLETVHRLRHGLADDSAEGTPDRACAMFADLPTGWPDLRDALVGAIHDSATPDRTDRLFPGDPAQFARGGVDLATGAAGVLYALHRTGAEIRPEHVDWLADRALRLPDPHIGLYTGLHGVAVMLDLLGRRERALEILDRVRGYEGVPAPDLRSGLAGAALSLRHFGRLDDALAIGERLRAEAVPLPDRPGLLRGRTGIAALFLTLFEDTGDRGWLDAAGALLRLDVADCRPRRPGTLYVVDENRRHLPYLDNGSVGLGVVLSRYLRHSADSELETALAAFRRSGDASVVVLSALGMGRAGLLLGLVEIGHPDDADVVRGHLRRLGWHAVNHRGVVAFPGTHLLRLSMDLFTGTAGVLLAAHAAIARDGIFLPLLDATDPTTRRGGR